MIEPRRKLQCDCCRNRLGAAAIKRSDSLCTSCKHQYQPGVLYSEICEDRITTCHERDRAKFVELAEYHRQREMLEQPADKQQKLRELYQSIKPMKRAKRDVFGKQIGWVEYFRCSCGDALTVKRCRKCEHRIERESNGLR